jgi:hypothetical protein
MLFHPARQKESQAGFASEPHGRAVAAKIYFVAYDYEDVG